jgi:integrase
MLEARDKLKEFPKRARQEDDLKELSVEKILSMNIGGPKLAERTYQKYLSFLTTVFNYCVDEAKTLLYSPCPKWKMSRDLQNDEGWEAFNVDDLVKLFTSSYFTKPAVRIRAPEKFWIPPIAYTTGMREDEICQLYKNDVRKIDGIWCFDINAKEDKKLKNKPSKRIIPIPPEILELGFLDYYRSVKHKRLWPNLKRGENGYSHNYSKMIGKHIRRHVTQNKKKVFHSLRDTFAEEMLASKVSPDEFGGILGHAPTHRVTALYSGKYPVDVMLDSMKQVKHRVDIVALLQPGKPKSQPRGNVIVMKRKNAKG